MYFLLLLVRNVNILYSIVNRVIYNLSQEKKK